MPKEQKTTPYTIRKAADALGCSEQHLYRLAKRGELPHTRLGRKVLIPSRVVEALLEGKNAQ
jgi:excisionase family DNA binding protein